jgi:hypothetical protein
VTLFIVAVGVGGCTSHQLAQVVRLSDGDGGGGGVGDANMAAECQGLPTATLDDLWVRYFAETPSSGNGGCALMGCHADGAGGLSFSSPAQLISATVNIASVAQPSAKRIVPGNPSASYFHYRLTAASGNDRMPNLGTGEFLTDAQLKEVAGWICAGAPGASNNDLGVGPLGPPTITGFTPSSGGTGDIVTIMGANFSTRAVEDMVAFNGVAATLSGAPTSAVLTATVPAGATTGPIRVTTPGGTAASATDFIVVPKPVITSLTASSTGKCGVLAGNQAFTLTLEGSNFAPGSTVAVTDAGGKSYQATMVTVTDTQITLSLMIPTAPADRYVQIVVSTPAPNPLSSAPAILGVAASATALSSIVTSTFQPSCAGMSCHNGGVTVPGSLDLTSATNARINLVNVTSKDCGPVLLVKPCDPRRSASFLIDKVLATATSRACNGATGPGGAKMPPMGMGLTPTQKDQLKDWVAQGAP